MTPAKVLLSSLGFVVGVAGTVILQTKAFAEEIRPVSIGETEEANSTEDLESVVAELGLNQNDGTADVRSPQEKLPVTNTSSRSKIPIAESIPATPVGPARGSTMDDVRMEVGEPREIINPIGDPPISRWVYTDYTVVFEYDRVVHVVAKRS